MLVLKNSVWQPTKILPWLGIDVDLNTDTLKDTHREKALSNKTPELTESMNYSPALTKICLKVKV